MFVAMKNFHFRLRFCNFIKIIGGLLFLTPTLLSASPDTSSWVEWLRYQVKQHPEIKSAQAEMDANYSMASSMEQALYNPEIDAELEKTGEDTDFRLGINQTIDWWNKRKVRQQQAYYTRISAQKTLEAILQQKIADILQALVEWQTAKQKYDIANVQEKQLDTLINLLKKRQFAGDLSKIDAELTLFSLSQTLHTTAQAKAQLRKSQFYLNALLSDWQPEKHKIPEQFWFIQPRQNQKQIQQWIEQHPKIMAAEADWQQLKWSEELAYRKTKADPTFGINAGKEGEEKIVGLQFSMPLRVRNNFNADWKMATQKSLAAEATLQALRRQQQFLIQSSYAVLREYQQHRNRWQQLMQGRKQLSEQLLKKQLNSGDINTTDYLLALQQRTEGLMAGIELSANFQLAYIDWLRQTGQINWALKQLSP